MGVASVGGTDALLTQLGTGRWSLLHILTIAYSSLGLLAHTLGGAFLAPDVDFTCIDTHASSTTSTTTPSLLSLDANNFTTQITTNFTTITTTPHTTTASSSVNEECGYIVYGEGEGGGEEGTWVECSEFQYDNSTFVSTITSEYGLVCSHEYLRTTYQSLYMVGIFVGSPINGFLADRYGRKRILMFAAWMYEIVALGSAWLPHLPLILLSRFLLGTCHAVLCFTGYVLAVEVAEPRYRTVVGFGIYIVWSLGTVLWGALAYAIRSWRLLQFVASVPGILVIPGLWLMDESPRWLAVKGRWQEAATVLGRAARWHRVPMPSDSQMMALKHQAEDVEEEEQQTDKSIRYKISNFKKGALLLYKTRRLRIITFLLYLAYLVAAMVYFGLSLSGGSLSNNRFIYMGLSGLMELPAYTLTVVGVQKFGRRIPGFSCFFFCSVALIALAFIPKEYNWLVVLLAMLGKVGITGAFQIIVFFSSELFPTEVRSRGIGTSFMMSRIGSIISPFITDIMGSRYPWAPSVVFGCASFVAAAAVLLLPETLGYPLNDTIADMEAQHANRPSQLSWFRKRSSKNKKQNDEDTEAMKTLTGTQKQI